MILAPVNGRRGIFFPVDSSVDSTGDRPHRMLGADLKDLGGSGADRMFQDLSPLYPEWAASTSIAVLDGTPRHCYGRMEFQPARRYR